MFEEKLKIKKSKSSFYQNKIKKSMSFPDWIVDEPDYKIKFYVIDNLVVYSEAKGVLSLENVKMFFKKYEQVIRESGLHKKNYHYRIMNWTQLRSSRWTARLAYMTEYKRFIQKYSVHSVIIFGLNSYMSTVLKLTSIFAPFKSYNCDDFDGALKKVYSLEGLKNFDDFEKEAFITSHTEKYCIELLDFLGQIDWDKTGMKMPLNVKKHPFKPVFEALDLIKKDFDTILKERDNIQQQLEVGRRLSALGNLTAGVAHEINNPLTILLGYLDRISYEKENLSLSSREYLSKMRNTIDRMTKIVKTMVVLFGKDKNEIECFDLYIQINSVVSLFQQFFKKNEIQVKINSPSSKVYINGNLVQFDQVLVNLLSNAKDALSGDDKSEKIITIQSRWLGEDKIEISVKDNGRGISSDDLIHIFDPFYTTKTVGKGMGLGLHLTYSTICAMGGTIKAHSDEGKGSEFVIVLPATREAFVD